MTPEQWKPRCWDLLMVTLCCLGLALIGLQAALAGGPVEFTGSVLKVDPAYNKLTVVKQGGGARFTFIVDDKTQFEGTTFKALKKGDAVTVLYVVNGSQYLAKKVSARGKEK